MAVGTRAPSTIITVPLQGQTEFTIPFEYLARKFVVLTLLGIDRQVLTLNTDYRFVSKTVVSLTVIPGAGFTSLEIRRVTSASERLVDFHDGSILRAADMNLSQVQTLHVAEEARDLTADTIGVNDEGHLDARNRKMVNLANAENPLDAVNLGQLQQFDSSTLNNANRAEAARDVAQAAERGAVAAKDAAAGSEAQALSWAQESNRHANRSDESANAAAASAAAGANSEREAGASAVSALHSATLALGYQDSALVSQLAAKASEEATLKAAESYGVVPVGAVMVCVTRPIPPGYLELNGQSFDVTTFPALAVLFPNGVLPDLRDKYMKMEGVDLSLLQHKGWTVPQHSHSVTGATAAHNHGRLGVGMDAAGAHGHSINEGYADNNGGAYPDWYRVVRAGVNSRYHGDTTLYTSNHEGNHQHNAWVDVGAHAHTLNGTTDVQGNGTTVETDRVGVIYVIKAFGTATNEDFINVSQYEARLSALENEVARAMALFSGIQTATDLTKRQLPFNMNAAAADARFEARRSITGADLRLGGDVVIWGSNHQNLKNIMIDNGLIPNNAKYVVADFALEFHGGFYPFGIYNTVVSARVILTTGTNSAEVIPLPTVYGGHASGGNTFQLFVHNRMAVDGGDPVLVLRLTNGAGDQGYVTGVGYDIIVKPVMVI